MSDIIDFNKFKKDKKLADSLEEEYLKVLTILNKQVGIPTSFLRASQVIYFALRYLEGTVNCLLTLTFLSVQDRKQLNDLKRMVIPWLQEIMDNIESL